MKSLWLDALDWMITMDSRLPAVFPPELPPESSPDFWFRAVQIEMSTRDTVSAKVRSLVNSEEFPSMTPIEAWLFRRRSQWATQVAILKVQQRIELDLTLHEVLVGLLIDSWHSDGCIALWNKAERGGAPHPENLDGLNPM